MNEFDAFKVEQAHAYLERIREAGDDCAAAKQLADDARSRSDGLCAVDYSRDRVRMIPNDDAMVNAIEKLRASIIGYVTTLAEYEANRYRAECSIELLEDLTEQKVLRLRYLLGYGWDEVASCLKKTRDAVMKIRRQALLHFYDVMPPGERDPLPNAQE